MPKITLLEKRVKNANTNWQQKEWVFKVGRTIYTLVEVWLDGKLVNGSVDRDLVKVAHLNGPFAQRLREAIQAQEAI
jgi:hypothetical protein